VKGFREFEFDLPSALLRRLVEVFGEIDSAELLPEIVSGIPDEQGVYLLEHLGATVYVGRQRLTRHCASIQHRRGLDPAAVHFKAIRNRAYHTGAVIARS
jgi:hypothetical protein